MSRREILMLADEILELERLIGDTRVVERVRSERIQRNRNNMRNVVGIGRLDEKLRSVAREAERERTRLTAKLDRLTADKTRLHGII